METDMIKQKAKIQDILVEIDNLKKYINQLKNNVRNEKIESYIEIINQNITKLQDEAENYYNEDINKEINTVNE